MQQTDDLEYRLISSIRNLTRAHKPAIGFLADAAGGPSAGTGYQDMQEQLAKSYDVRSLAPGDSIQHDTALAAIVLAGAPDSVPAAQLARLERYLDHGGSILVLAGGMAIAPDMPMARPRRSPGTRCSSGSASRYAATWPTISWPTRRSRSRATSGG